MRTHQPTQMVDFAIIGSGGAAFAAAIRASTLGKSVVMIERGTVGGTCVNTGCVPSKALLAAAGARHGATDAARYPGITATAGPVDMPAVIAGKDALVEQMRSDKYLDLITAYGWQLIRGEATFTGSPDDPVLEVTCTDGTIETVQAQHYLLATGSTPTIPEIAGLEDIEYLTSTTAMDLSEVPESLIILGAGYVALEQAQLFSRLGSKVTVLARSRLLSREEPEVADTLREVFADEGIQAIHQAAVTAVATEATTGGVLVTATIQGQTRHLHATHLLVATGRTPVTAGLNLASVGVDTGPGGEVVVDAHLASSNPRIWAAGDVTGHPQFVYVASSHGGQVVDNAFTNANHAVDYTHLPRVTFTAPAVGAVGMTDHQAQAAGIRCTCRVLPLDYVPRAQVNRDTRGFIKIVADADTNQIVGITAVATDAGDLAAAGGYILAANMTVTQLATQWSPYLTMAEGLKIAAQSFTTDVSMLSCCAT